MRTPFTGAGTALITPFTRTGDLDEAAVRRLGRRQVDAGIHFLSPCGTTGENPTLTPAERLRIVEILADEVGGKVPILAGAGGYNTKEVVHLARELEKAGANGSPLGDAVLQQADAGRPVSALPRDRREHVAADRGLQRAGPHGRERRGPTLLRLAAIPNIIGVKEASGNMQQMCEICRAVPSDFLVLSGDDALTLPLMAVGGRGVISVISNEMPAEMAQMVEAAERDDFAAARAIHNRIMPLMLVNFVEANPVPVKAAMAAMGLIEEAYRLPIVGPKPESKEKIVKVLKDLGLLKGAYV